MKYALLILVLCLTTFCIAENKSNEIINYDWALSFEEQLISGVWDGKFIRKQKSLEKHYNDTLMYLDELRYESSSGVIDGLIFYIDGHYYSYELFSIIEPKLANQLKQFYNTNRMYEIFQHASPKLLLIRKYPNDGLGPDADVMALEIPPFHSLCYKADNEKFELPLVQIGTFQYTNTLGSTQTVRKYKIMDTTELLKKFPDEMTYDNYVRFIYHIGLESDFNKELIEPHKDCSCCNATGKKTCQICKGEGKVHFLDAYTDIINTDSKQRRRIKAQIRTRKKDKLATRRSGSGSGMGMGGFMGPMGPDRRHASWRSVGRKNNRSRGLYSRKRQEKDLRRKEKIHQLKTAKKTDLCAICKGKGWLGCHECILIDKPKYMISAKEEYLSRWK